MLCSSSGKQDSHLFIKMDKHTSKSCRNSWLYNPCCCCNPMKQGPAQPCTSCWEQKYSGFLVLCGWKVGCCCREPYLGKYCLPEHPTTWLATPVYWESMLCRTALLSAGTITYLCTNCFCLHKLKIGVFWFVCLFNNVHLKDDFLGAGTHLPLWPGLHSSNRHHWSVWCLESLRSLGTSGTHRKFGSATLCKMKSTQTLERQKMS